MSVSNATLVEAVDASIAPAFGTVDKVRESFRV
jgi:hypothetical protein